MKLSAAQQRDFDADVRSRSNALSRTAHLLTGDRSDAEDLLQLALESLVGGDRTTSPTPTCSGPWSTWPPTAGGSATGAPSRTAAACSTTTRPPPTATAGRAAPGPRPGVADPHAPPARRAGPALLRRPVRGRHRLSPGLLYRDGEEHPIQGPVPAPRAESRAVERAPPWHVVARGWFASAAVRRSGQSPRRTAVRPNVVSGSHQLPR